MPVDNPRNVDELVELYYVLLYRYAFRLSGSAADADDLAQETFCKAQAQFKQLRDRSRAKPWLFSILRNLYLHKLRTAKQHATVPLDSVAGNTLMGMVTRLIFRKPFQVARAAMVDD